MGKEKMLKLLGKFLAFMLACTILSRSSASMTTAVVQTASPQRTALSHTVSATGKVAENRVQAVQVEAGHKISRISVQEGDRVEPGDVLLQLDVRALDHKISSARREIEKIKWEIEDMESARRIQEEKKELLLARAQEDYAAAAEKGDQDAARAADELNEAINRLNQYYADLNSRQEIQGESGGIEEQEQGLAEAVKTAQAAYDDALLARQEGLLNAQRAWEDALAEKPADSTDRMREADMKEKQIQLRKLEKLRKKEGKIVSPIKGTVTKLNAAPGESTTEAAPVLLADLSSGCRLIAQVGKEEEKYLEKDMPVTVSSELKKKKEENLKIHSIEVSAEDPSLLEICVYLPADLLEIGDSAEMTAEKKSKTYSTCIPLQALHEANGMKFVYVLGEKETVLGKQLTAMKHSVTVQEQNEQYAALADGSLAVDEKVIQDSSKAIDEGSPVRLEGS